MSCCRFVIASLLALPLAVQVRAADAPVLKAGVFKARILWRTRELMRELD
jgi:hypothetical protein